MISHQHDGVSLELDKIGSTKSQTMPQSGGIRSYQVVNEGTDDQFILYGYSRSVARTALTWIFIVLTAGFLRLIFYWKPHWFLQCCCNLADLSVCEYVLLKDRYQQWFVENVFKIDSTLNPNDPNDSRNFVTPIRPRYSSIAGREQADDSTSEPFLVSSAKPLSTKILFRQPFVFRRWIYHRRHYQEMVFYQFENRENHRYFINKKWRYVWQEAEYKFVKLLGIEHNVKCDYFRQIRPLTVEERAQKKTIHGENSINIRLTPIIQLLIQEVLSPFYIFQIFSCISWFADEYVIYASCIVFISVVSVIFTLYEVHKNERALRDTVHQSEVTTVAIYNPETQEEEQRDIISEDLVPGDVIIVRSSSTMQCDAVLLNGNVIVNEAMLTGESIPVTKIQIPYYQASMDLPALQQQFDIHEHNRHILFSGTNVIQTRYYGAGDVRAVVVRTGFHTAKGELVRSILYPKPVDFKFNTDTYKYVGGMAIIALGGMIFSLVLRIIRKEQVGAIIKRTIDVITIAVPPALPAALSAGLVYAQNRLKKVNIFCISPRSINICGSLNTVVFDKTGTLTEDGLDLHCVLPIIRTYNSNTTEQIQQVEFGSEVTEATELNWRDEEAHSMIIVNMAACHTITRINGELAGDPLDLKMLGFTQYELYEPAANEQANFDMLFPTIVRPINSPSVEPPPERLSASVRSLIAGNIPFEIGIVRQLPFSSSLQRTSVIVRILAKDSFDLLTKGSPEKIAELSRPETIPKNFNEILSTYAKQGYRVLALAYKPLELNYVKVQRIEREKIEHNLTFLGLVIMENRLKPQTEGVLKILSNANIRTIMCTGDNMLTALSVARDCDMIPDDAKIIVIEVADSNSTPTFTYAEVFNRRVKEVRYDLNSHRLIELDRRSPYHFAISGKSFQIVREEHPELLHRLCVRGTVFARMLPEQKQQLIETLQELGYFVSMCGDGANDVGALKAAHAGISLSTADASVASPFTSRTPTIECVPTIIREGRAALVTSFGVVKYMVAYSLTQFLTVIMLYTIGNNLTDYEFLLIDLGLITLLVLLFSRTVAYPHLDPKPPRTKLISWRPLVSLIGHLSICAAFQAFIFEYVKKQPWYEPFEFNTDKIYVSHINTAVFLQSTFQYIWESVVFSRGAPYRRSIFSNWLFLLSIIATFAFSVVLLFIPVKSIYSFFELRIIPDIKFKIIIFALAILNFILMFMFEEYIIENDSITFKHAPLSSTSRTKKSRTGTHHSQIENTLRLEHDWPPILATPSEEETKPPSEHVLVNENKKNNNNNQTTTNEYL